MESRLIIKRGDKHDVQLTISNAPASLVGGTVKVLVTPSLGGTTQTFTGSLIGNVVTWSLDGTLDVGNYRLEVEVTVGALIVTAPSDGTMGLVVLQDLG